MSRLITAVAITAALTGCDGTNPFQVAAAVDPAEAPIIDPDNPVDSNGIPLVLSGDGAAANLTAVAYNAIDQTLSVDMAALDRNDEEIDLEAYAYNATLTALAPGYNVFSNQDDALDRMFVAIVAQSEDGSVVGAVVMDGGQFTKSFGGGFYATDGNYTPGNPSNDTGLVSYAGTYAGLSNLPADGNELIEPNGNPNPDILPYQPAQISGEVFINADFGDNSVNGAIYNREFENINDDFSAATLDTVFMIPTPITEDGTFFGETENRAQDNIGSYGGTFGGTEASGIAGVVHLDGDFVVGAENEQEYGVFVLNQCGQAGEDPICGTIPVNP
jgi:hypothetical protein